MDTRIRAVPITSRRNTIIGVAIGSKLNAAMKGRCITRWILVSTIRDRTTIRSNVNGEHIIAAYRNSVRTFCAWRWTWGHLCLTVVDDLHETTQGNKVKFI